MKKVLIVAGEASGDIHGANLVKAVKELNSDIKFFGMGGNQMKSAGVEILYHIKEFGVVGLFEVLKKVPALKKIQKHFISIIENENPDLVILIDYPGFNIRLAEKINGMNTKILYYILPQVWAWGKGRIEKMAHLTDAMASIIPFEPEIFNKVGGNCTYIGHPLIHRIETYKFNQDLINSLKSGEGKNILILPGSRMNEIEKIFPAMVKTAEIINSKMQDEKVTFYISVAETIDTEEISKRLKGINFKFKLFTENLYEHLKAADFAMVTSGTATLETALFNLPMVLLYKTSALTYFLARSLVKVDNIGLVNIISGKKIVNEYIQSLNPSVIADEIIQLIQAPEKLEAIKRELLKVQNKLGKKNASENGAKMLLSMLD